MVLCFSSFYSPHLFTHVYSTTSCFASRNSVIEIFSDYNNYVPWANRNHQKPVRWRRNAGPTKPERNHGNQQDRKIKTSKINQQNWYSLPQEKRKRTRKIKTSKTLTSYSLPPPKKMKEHRLSRKNPGVRCSLLRPEALDRSSSVHFRARIPNSRGGGSDLREGFSQATPIL